MNLNRRLAWLILAVVLAAGLAWPLAGAAEAQVPPPLPALYSGTITAGGDPVPDGLLLTARVSDYESEPITVSGGRYENLVVAPPDSSYVQGPVTFHLDGVQADQIESHVPGEVKLRYELIFSALPEPTQVSVPSLPPITAQSGNGNIRRNNLTSDSPREIRPRGKT